MRSLLISTGLLVATQALVLKLSTQVSLRQSLVRGYLALGIPILGMLLALWAAAQVRALRRRAGDSAERRDPVVSCGTCAVVVAGWAAVLYFSSHLL